MEAIDYENFQTHLITVEARSSDGSHAYQDFNINVLNDVYDDNNFQVSVPIDIDTAPNQILENSLVGTNVGITVLSSDNDLSNNVVTYSILNNTDNIFSINQDTGIVTLSGTIDYEVSSSYNITVKAESTDGSSNANDFQIDVLNDIRDDLPQIIVRRLELILEKNFLH